MGMSRRTFIKTFAVLAAGSAVGCAAKKPSPNEIPAYKPDVWPTEAPANVHDGHCFVVRLAVDEKGEILYGPDGSPLIDGLTTPAIRFKEDDPLKFYETVFTEPTPLNKMREAKTMSIVRTLEEAREFRKVTTKLKTITNTEERKTYVERLAKISSPMEQLDLEAYRELFADLQKKTEESLAKNKDSINIQIPSDEEKLAAFNARVKRIQRNTIFKTEGLKALTP